MKTYQAIRQAFQTWQSPPDLTISEWADRYRYLSSESSAEPGKWYTSRAEYQRGIMDALNEPNVDTIVIMSSAQVGKTEIGNNIAGYFIDQDPSPILVVQPTLEMAKTWSKDRLSPMLRDTPNLRGKVAEVRSKDSDNTIFHKSFPGGHITIVGANSAAGLASRPIRVVIFDEIDRYPISAGAEGDPVKLGEKRTATFWNRKKIQLSTPTVKDVSRIEKSFENSDKRYFFVPCPQCGFEQRLIWGQVKWDKTDGEHNPKTAYYKCCNCDHKIDDGERYQAIKKGHWIATSPCKGVAGFHLSELYSPWKKLSDTVAEFLESKDDPELLKTWINTALGEPFEEQGEKIDEGSLLARCEDYNQIPKGAVLLTCGVDVQQDRLELEIVGWGEREESWSVDYKVIYGSPKDAETWQKLDDCLFELYEHQNGLKLPIAATCIDTGGGDTQSVYDYGKNKFSKNIFLIKGVGGEGVPVVGRVSTSKIGKYKKKIKLFPIGVDQAKDVIYSRLKIPDFGPGFCHYPTRYDQHYFDMLTAEKRITKFVKGFAKREWQKIRPRNEALDCRVYAYAALKILNPNLAKIKERLEMKEAEIDKNQLEQPLQKVEKQAPQEQEPEKKTKKPKRRKSNFVNRW